MASGLPMAIALLALLLSLVTPARAATVEQTRPWREAIDRELTRGNFRGAVQKGRAALQAMAEKGTPEEVVLLSLQLAGAYQGLGENLAAIELLHRALARVAGDERQQLIAEVEVKLGEAYLLSGTYAWAGELLAAALGAARALNLPMVAASALNGQGNLLVLQKEYAAALAAYREGIELVGRASGRDPAPDPTLVARIHANAGRAAMFAGMVAEAAGHLSRSSELHRALADSHAKAVGLINIAKSFQGLAPLNPGQAAGYATLALALDEDAVTIAQTMGDRLALSYGAGYAGQIHEQNHEGDQALACTEQAESAAAAAAAPEALYLWQGQEGRLLAGQGRTVEAIDAYRRAVATLQTIRGESDGECRHFNQWATQDAQEQVTFGLVELLLQQEEGAAGGRERDALLAEVIASLESLKSQELRRYFQNTCINEQRIRFAERGSIPAKSAIVYLLPLAERLELILSLPEGLRRFTVAVDRETLTHVVREFRYRLENRTSREYLASSQRLYSLLVTPYAREVVRQGVDTLVFVADGVLRTIPFAALHDGKGFLVDRWAVAIIPSLTLTDLGQEKRPRQELLLAGISQANQGFAPLASVDDELQGIHALYGGELLLNQGFTALALRTAIDERPYAMVHIATHGEFMADSAATFILAWDGRIDMDLLEKTLRPGRYRQRPIDLLTLSACQSAAGSERAALGLAGLALKTGVRSALATLWYVDDRASSALMAEFYRRLTDPARGKAHALQAAQKGLLADNRYRHPAYWSPFMLIGHWN